MGDVDIAYAFAKGKVWFKVPETIKIVIKGEPPKNILAKDVTLFLLSKLGRAGLLGYVAEFYGDWIEKLSLDGRITIASMMAEMGGICGFFPNPQIYADESARYAKTIELKINDLKPLISLPGDPANVRRVEEFLGKKIDSAFIGSCTNGRYEDLLEVANVLKNRKIAPGVVLKIVPSTDQIWKRCLKEGLISVFKDAGALVGNAGCAGCAAGQIGQNGEGEVTISTGNRNFPGKQGKGEVYLASPAVAAASAVAGEITLPDRLPAKVPIFPRVKKFKPQASPPKKRKREEKPLKIKRKVWVIDRDNIDTDMIYHNKYLSITDINEMGKYAFSNSNIDLKDFSKKVEEGDLIISGKNFGCGSSRQQAVDCFKALKLGGIIAESFGSIYERNAINSGFPIIVARDIKKLNLRNGDEIEVDFLSGKIMKIKTREIVKGNPFSEVQLDIYRRGGLLEE